jgi:hypothetical protein
MGVTAMTVSTSMLFVIEPNMRAAVVEQRARMRLAPGTPFLRHFMI